MAESLHNTMCWIDNWVPDLIYNKEYRRDLAKSEEALTEWRQNEDVQSRRVY